MFHLSPKQPIIAALQFQHLSKTGFMTLFSVTGFCGHCGLQAHLKRIGIMDSALCDCKEAEQTVHHILQDCSIRRKQRHQLWPQDESTTNKLWGTAEDLRHTTQFLASLSKADQQQKKKTGLCAQVLSISGNTFLYI